MKQIWDDPRGDKGEEIMKKMCLNEKILDLGGKPILGPVKTDGSSEPFTIRDVLIQHLVGYKGNEPKKLILAMKVAQKIYGSTEVTFDFEDAEFDLIEEAALTPQYSALVMAPIYEMMQKSKEE